MCLLESKFQHTVVIKALADMVLLVSPASFPGTPLYIPYSNYTDLF